MRVHLNVHRHCVIYYSLGLTRVLNRGAAFLSFMTSGHGLGALQLHSVFTGSCRMIAVVRS
jgi:hypothetical protein